MKTDRVSNVMYNYSRTDFKGVGHGISGESVRINRDVGILYANSGI